MDASLLEKRRRRLTAQTPLIGGWLRRSALSSLIKDGSTEATIALVEAATRGQGEIGLVTAAQYAPIYCRATLETGRGVSCLALRPDLRVLTTEEGESPGTMRWWSLSEGALTKTLNWQQDNVSSVAISPDGGLLAGGLRTGEVRLWSLPDDRLIKALKRHRHIVTSVAISPDGRLL